MRIITNASLIFLVFVLSEKVGLAQNGTCSGMSLGQGASLNGFVPFPSTSLWNLDVSSAPVDPNSNNIINFIGATVTLHADFGAGTFHRQTIGIPYQVVGATQPKVNVQSVTQVNSIRPTVVASLPVNGEAQLTHGP